MAAVPMHVTESLDKITEYLNSSEKVAQKVVDEMKKLSKSESRSAEVNAVFSSIKKIGDSIDTFQNGNVTEILSSAIDITASISEIIPEVGPFISAACSLLSAVLGAVGSEGTKSMANVVKEVIEEALEKYEDSELRDEVEGTTRMYIDSLAFLHFDAGTVLTETEVSQLPSNVPIYTGIKMLGILANKVHDKAEKNDLTHGKRAIAYTNLYVKLAILRSLIFMQMETVIKASGHGENTVEAIRRVAQKEEETDKEFIKYLTTPTYDKAYLFVQLLPSNGSLLSNFLRKHELSFQNLEWLTKNDYTFSPAEWTDYYMYTDEKWLYGKKSPGTDGNFLFEAINSEYSLFYIHPKRWPESYIYMTDSYCGCTERKPGPQGEWKIIQYEDGKYMFSSVEWPSLFVYMMDNGSGTIAGWEGDPGPQGHWIIL